MSALASLSAASASASAVLAAAPSSAAQVSVDLGQFRLARTLQHQAVGEHQIEVARQLLTDEPQYAARHAFDAIAGTAGATAITAADLRGFLKRYGVYANDEDAARLIRRYTSASGAVAATISFADFQHNLEPPGSPPVRRNAHSAVADASAAAAAPADERLVAYKLKTEVEVDRNLRVMRELLSDDVGASLHEAFRRADTHNTGHLSRAELQHVMAQSGAAPLSAAEWDALWRLYDPLGVDRVSYTAFLRNLLPDDIGPTIAVLGGNSFPTAVPPATPSPAARGVAVADPAVSASLLVAHGGDVKSPAAHQHQYERDGAAASAARAALYRDARTPLNTPLGYPYNLAAAHSAAAAPSRTPQKVYYKSTAAYGGVPPDASLPSTFGMPTSNYAAVQSASPPPAGGARANGVGNGSYFGAVPAVSSAVTPMKALPSSTPLRSGFASPLSQSFAAARHDRLTASAAPLSYDHKRAYQSPAVSASYASKPAAAAAAPIVPFSDSTYRYRSQYAHPPPSAAPGPHADRKYGLGSADRARRAAAAPAEPLSPAVRPLSFDDALPVANGAGTAASVNDSFFSAVPPLGGPATNGKSSSFGDANASFFADPAVAGLSPIQPSHAGSGVAVAPYQLPVAAATASSAADTTTAPLTHTSFVQALYPLHAPTASIPKATDFSAAHLNASRSVVPAHLTARGTQTPARPFTAATATPSKSYGVAVANGASGQLTGERALLAYASPTAAPVKASAAGGATNGGGALIALGGSTKCSISYCERNHAVGSALCPLHAQIYPNRDALEAGLVHTLRRQMDVERELELMRRRLALHPTYSLANAFAYFDPHHTGFVTITQLERALLKAPGGGVRLSHAELVLLVRLLDRDGDGKVSYSDFIRRLMPRDERYSDLVTHSPRKALVDAAAGRGAGLNHTALAAAAAKPKAANGKASGGGAHRPRALSIGAARELALTLARHIELEQQLDRVRAALVNRPDFSLHTALTAIDRDGTGRIGVHQFRQFLIDQGVVTLGPAAASASASASANGSASVSGEVELSSLLSRYDKHNTGTISYLDFLDELVLPSLSPARK